MNKKNKKTNKTKAGFPTLFVCKFHCVRVIITANTSWKKKKKRKEKNPKNIALQDRKKLFALSGFKFFVNF